MFRSRKGLKAAATLLREVYQLPDLSVGGAMSDLNLAYQERSRTRSVSFRLLAGLLILPLLFYWFLWKHGYSSFARVVGFVWLLIWLAAFQQSSSQIPDTHAMNTSAASQAQETVPPTSPARPWTRWVTLKQFELLRPGLITYEQISRLWGPGELRVSTNSDGSKIESYDWKNPDGSVMSLTFRGDVLVVKAQSGLPQSR